MHGFMIHFSFFISFHELFVVQSSFLFFYISKKMLTYGDKIPVKQSKKNIFARPQPDGDGYQISYEFDGSRRIYRFGNNASTFEKSPHGAGSFHNPEQHQVLMERIEDYIRNS